MTSYTSYTRADYEAEFLAELDKKAPVVEWNDFIEEKFFWKQGQHIGIIGPTGSGKTYLSIFLLTMRDYVVVLATKPYDETVDELVNEEGYTLWRKWHNRPAEAFPKRVIWPDAKDLKSQGKQRAEFMTALSDIYRSGGWCVYVDELWYMIHQLKMEIEVKTYLLQARSNNISLVGCSQRPSWIPVEMFDQPEHLFFFRDNDERNLKTIAGISWLSANLVRALVARLEPYQFLYINTRSAAMIRCTAPPPDEDSQGAGINDPDDSGQSTGEEES